MKTLTNIPNCENINKYTKLSKNIVLPQTLLISTNYWNIINLLMDTM